MSMYRSPDTSWPMSAIGNSGARSSGTPSVTSARGHRATSRPRRGPVDLQGTGASAGADERSGMSFGWREFPGGTVYALCDGAGPVFRSRDEAFPDATAQTWAAAGSYRWAAAGEGGQWILHFHCYAIRFDDGRTVLVAAGIGPADAPRKAWAPE